MAKFKEQEFYDMADFISGMQYQPGDKYDHWYPTIDEINEYIKTFDKVDVKFLIWLSDPKFTLTPEQEQTKKYILKLLYNPEIVEII